MEYIHVSVPLNPAATINIQLVNNGNLNGAVLGLYRHKTQQKNKCLTILNCTCERITLFYQQGKLMQWICSIEKTEKAVIINSVTLVFKSKTFTDKLWADLKLENNEILKQVPEISINLYTMLNEYSYVFTNDSCHVGKTSRETFKIELLPSWRPVNPPR